MTSEQELEAMAHRNAVAYFAQYVHPDAPKPPMYTELYDSFIEGARAGARLQRESDAKLCEGLFTGAAWDSQGDGWAAHFARAIRASDLVNGQKRRDELSALRAANASLVAGLEKADCTCDAEDSYYHSAGCYRCESLARARELLGGK